MGLAPPFGAGRQPSRVAPGKVTGRTLSDTKLVVARFVDGQVLARRGLFTLEHPTPCRRHARGRFSR